MKRLKKEEVTGVRIHYSWAMAWLIRWLCMVVYIEVDKVVNGVAVLVVDMEASKVADAVYTVTLSMIDDNVVVDKAADDVADMVVDMTVTRYIGFMYTQG